VTNSDPEYNIDSLPFHRDVANAIVARDAVAAEKAMTILLSDTQDRLNVMR
jgi:DNA-binding FadR family transcriptional regulator